MISSMIPAIRRKEIAPKIPPMSADWSVGGLGGLGSVSDTGLGVVESEAKT